jgi:hypothetical protein
MKSALKDDPENIVQMYSTHGGIKKKYWYNYIGKTSVSLIKKKWK